jgi:hypothetical protein
VRPVARAYELYVEGHPVLGAANTTLDDILDAELAGDSGDVLVAAFVMHRGRPGDHAQSFRRQRCELGDDLVRHRFTGPIDPTTVTSDTLFLVSLGVTGPGQDYMPWGTVIGIDQVVFDPLTNTLHVESDETLAQRTRFALIVTRGVRDQSGGPIGASDEFRRFRVSVRGDYKDALLDAMHAARHAGIPEEEIAVASVFTTRSTTTLLEKMSDQIREATPEPADFLLGPGGQRTVFSLDELTNIVFNQQIQVSPPFPPQTLELNLIRNTYPGVVGALAFGRYVSPDCEVHVSECDGQPSEYIPAVGTRSGTPEVRGTNEIYSVHRGHHRGDGVTAVEPGGPKMDAGRTARCEIR